LESLESRIVPATFRVNTMADTIVANLQNGKDASGKISLRSALMAANARTGSDKIILPRGTFTLALAGTGEDQAATGDLDILDSVTIQGASASNTILDGAALDRVFDVLGGSVQITKLAIRNGKAEIGGGIRILGGQVTLKDAEVRGNLALGQSGIAGTSGLDVIGLNPAVTAVAGAGNPGQAGQSALGGGIAAVGGSLNLNNVLIIQNQARGGNGGNGGNGGSATGAAGAANVSGGDAQGGAGGAGGLAGEGIGGGLYVDDGVSVIIQKCRFETNEAISGRGGVGGKGGQAFGGRGGDGTSPGFAGAATGGNGGAGGFSAVAKGGAIANQGSLTFSGIATQFTNNNALGNSGGEGGGADGSVAGTGGSSTAGGGGTQGGFGQGSRGGDGGTGGFAQGGAVFNSGSFTAMSALQFQGNRAIGGLGGSGGRGAVGTGGRGGNGSGTASGGSGGIGRGGQGGTAGRGGDASGGAVYNQSNFSITPPETPPRSIPASRFLSNSALGGNGASGGQPGQGFGGQGGNGGGNANAIRGGNGIGGNAGFSSSGGHGQGGAFFNTGTANLTGITIQIEGNVAQGGNGSIGLTGANGTGGPGGLGTIGGNGGAAFGGVGGSGGQGGKGQGGGLYNDVGAHLVINTRLNAKPNSAQAKATSLIKNNFALLGNGAAGGNGGSATRGTPGGAGGASGATTPGAAGTPGANGTGIGGGSLSRIGGSAVFINVDISLNAASTSDNDIGVI
jgi:hypothetical protein